MTEQEAIQTLKDWKSRTLNSQSMDLYLHGLRFRYYSVTKMHLSDDPIQIVKAVQELRTIANRIHEFTGE